jgi:hypothetical protein
MEEAILVADRRELKTSVRVYGSEFGTRDSSVLNIGNRTFDGAACAALGMSSGGEKQKNSQANARGPTQRYKWQIHFNPSPVMRREFPHRAFRLELEAQTKLRRER